MAADEALQGPLTVSAIQKALNNKLEAGDWLFDHLIERLPEPYKTAVPWITLLRSFNHESMETLLEPQKIKFDSNDFHRLRHWGFINHHDDWWSCKDFIREMQHIYQTKSRPFETRAFYLSVKEYYEKLWQQNQDDHYRLEALYYDLLVSPKEGYLRWKEVLKEAQIGWRKEFCGQLIGLAEEKNIQLKLRALNKAEVAFERGRLNYYQYQWIAAIEAYEKANNLFGEGGHKIGQADAQKAIGDVYQLTNDNEAAIISYNKALQHFNAANDRIGIGSTLLATGYAWQQSKL